MDWWPRVGEAVQQTACGPAAHTVRFIPKQTTTAEPQDRVDKADRHWHEPGPQAKIAQISK